MINPLRTKEKFGYEIENLSLGTHKQIVVDCDYCKCEFYPVYKNYNIAVKKNEAINFQKMACESCRQFKIIEVKKRDGVYEEGKKIANQKMMETKNKNGCVQKVAQMNREIWANKTKEEIAEITERREKAILEKHGVTHFSKTEEFKEKFKNTCLEKYGAENPSLVEEFKEKRRLTNQERFGVDNAFQSEEIKNKAKQTSLEKYGVERYGDTQEFKDLVEEKMQGKWDEVVEKRRATCMEKYGVNHPNKVPELAQKQIQTRKDNGTIKLIDGKTVKEFCKDNNVSISYTNQLIQQGIDPSLMEKSVTQIEQVIKEILIKNDIKFSHNGNIGKRKYDFLIPEFNLILEADSFYWHSDFNDKEQKYHQIKRDFYIESGYKPLFFRQNEIIEKPKIIESIILNKIGRSERVFARNCGIELCEFKDAKNWFEENHLMGSGRGTCLFLINKETKERLCGIQIVKKKDYGYEISRFATKYNTSVVGGFSKLISHAHDILKFKSLITYIDLRYGNGNYLKELGFDKTNESLSFGWTNGKQIFHRMTFEGETGYQHGFAKIWDCGQAKWIKMY